MALTGKLLQPAIVECHEAAQMAEAWNLMPLRSRTAKCRTRAAAMLSLAGAGLFEMRQEQCRYPIKVFGLLDELQRDALAAEILEDLENRVPFRGGQWHSCNATKHQGFVHRAALLT